jgi:hypothetical protein
MFLAEHDSKLQKQEVAAKVKRTKKKNYFHLIKLNIFS